MQFKHTQVYNFENALRGMRNPLDSWGKSDSCFGIVDVVNTDALTKVCDAWIERVPYEVEEYSKEYYDLLEQYQLMLVKQGVLRYYGEYDDLCEVAFLGPNDMNLAKTLIKAGPEHAKFMRQIFVSVDIAAPLYWWKEMDTYKIGTTANSTSTMHKLTSKPITLSSFETDDYDEEWFRKTGIEAACDTWIENNIIYFLETLREEYIKTGDKRYWKELIRWLPESYMQTRTWTANYAVLRNIYFQRKNHKLKEWNVFCQWVEDLPYAHELILTGENDETN